MATVFCGCSFLDFSQENSIVSYVFCFIPVKLQAVSHEAHAIDFQMLLLGFLDVQQLHELKS